MASDIFTERRLFDLPASDQNFASIRDNDFLYVDKTEYIFKIARQKGAFFLARPRRFGKSLLLDTLNEAFKGNKKIFEGLWISSSNYSFPKYPIIRITMKVDSEETATLRRRIIGKLKYEAEENGIAEVNGETPGEYLENLINAIYKKEKKDVVVLIDEYDHPINSVFGDQERAKLNLKELHSFYGVLKPLMTEGKIRCLFVTGVTKVTHASLFSAENNLRDLTLDPEYSAACGFTLDEFDKYFDPYVTATLLSYKSLGLRPLSYDKKDMIKEILRWYDGYSFDGVTRILNPISLINFFNRKAFIAYWFNNNTPSFLVEYAEKHPLDFVKSETVNFKEEDLLNIHLGDIKLAPLLFQTGYLTIHRRNADDSFRLRGPNEEVNRALSDRLLRKYIIYNDETNALLAELRDKIVTALNNFDSINLAEAFSGFLKWVPHQLHLKVERFYHAIIFVGLRSLGFNVTPEVSGSGGDADLLIIIKQPQVAFVCEFKYEQFVEIENRDTEKALKNLLAKGIKRAKKQIKDKGYADGYGTEYKIVKKVAVSIVGKTNVAVEIYENDDDIDA
ncbi:MAG: ATP-binding protein [Deltaproteobacteria bacterium]|jgi:hypothetical protein|nr:ATP-binding protein [Deltaproteobacteria bacterium]